MIVVSGYVRVRPEKMDELRPFMRAALEGTRKEPGCLMYAYGEDVLDPGLIRIVERWESWEAIEAHTEHAVHQGLGRCARGGRRHAGAGHPGA